MYLIWPYISHKYFVHKPVPSKCLSDPRVPSCPWWYEMTMTMTMKSNLIFLLWIVKFLISKSELEVTVGFWAKRSSCQARQAIFQLFGGWEGGWGRRWGVLVPKVVMESYNLKCSPTNRLDASPVARKSRFEFKGYNKTFRKPKK